ncbi:MAG TPA: ClpXP protease specificity-enhancing factor SspB [Rhizomicrobium sp.]|nr:ClpXP protease specificity-enhancing factor SspB [Rhizomicrobium sp.]
MAKDFIGYQTLIDSALRGVVREALRRVEKQGLVGNHHFCLTFKTRFPGLEIPDFLREQYPEEMMIILQHQFSGLKAKEHHFEVTLNFRKIPATLVIPYEALTAFSDPGVQFVLPLRPSEGNGRPAGGTAKLAPVAPEQPKPDSETPPKPAAPGEVVSLDSFRKK